jgi:plasmid maintenance system antidote protein VapI
MNRNSKQRNPQMLPKGTVKSIANRLNCRPSYVSSIIHNPEKFTGPTAELVKKLVKNLKEQYDNIQLEY